MDEAVIERFIERLTDLKDRLDRLENRVESLEWAIQGIQYPEG